MRFPYRTSGAPRRGASMVTVLVPCALVGSVLAALMTIAWLPAAASQAARRQGPPREGPGMSGPAHEDEGDDLAETLEVYMIAKMKRALGLTREQQEKIVPLVQDLSEARRRFNRERRLAMMMLRPLVEDPNSREEEIRNVLARLDENESAFRTEESRTQEQIRAALTPRQQAEYIFFQERFRHEMQERLRRFHEMGGDPREEPRGRRRPTPPPPPPPEDR